MQTDLSSIETVHVLWTGGWDSTYRVLDLVLVHRATVQPHYIFDPARRSARHEIRAMMNVRHGIARRDPNAARRLQPLRITVVDEIAPNAAVTDRWKSMRPRPMHQQYDWLNRYVAENHLEGIEIGLTKDNGEIGFGVDDTVAVPATDGTSSWALPRDHGNPQWELFERFTLPLLDVLKVELRQRAVELGFNDLLDKTWFCHQPVGDKPCGFCLICRSSVQQGMGYRLSRTGRIRNRFWRPLYLLRAAIDNPQLLRNRLKHPSTLRHIGEFERTRERRSDAAAG